MNDQQYITIGERHGWGDPQPFGISAVDQRQHIYVIGKTGSGKTTLLRVLAGLLPPSSGKMSFVRNQKPKIGMVFQDVWLIDELTARDNVALKMQAGKLHLYPPTSVPWWQQWLPNTACSRIASR
jgi:ABC-type nitrate/sulfonate/bicarbonate transport system ATPase subunit